MTTPFDSEIAELLEKYRRQRAELGEMQREIKEITATAVAGQNAVKVTVDAHGEIQDLSFPSGAYRRMAPLELAAAVKQTINAARAEAAGQMQEVMRRYQGDEYLDLSRADGDWSQMLPEEPPMPKMVRDMLGMFGTGPDGKP
ncbi:YbaB/EbfC family nucleoid-associated protein [Actinoplanes derwentensis]|uniref:Conserved DNA-binding protein YbaB n=1 Tax=Actinoplanes derwentensis TaxID=113562 RepID=A0A1H2CX36_9ACTN|nr:YbaB/EbfC family nucleoid-associated protein [Actinoplanes derwentensis]GID88330.1 hypothetical protein Ade03nite_72540 [Actinoplanes derwentensis]SDT74616.1 Conserved DNA-binding protein YbaB [Actinoplanes derwentensis]